MLAWTCSKESSLNLLFNNAGVMTPPEGQKTPQGFELQLGTNLLGPTLLTELLLPTMLATAARSPVPEKGGKLSTVRIIHTSSMAHTGAPKGGIVLDKALSNMQLYGQSKWGNIVYSNELARRYGSAGIVSHSLSPGLVVSDLQRHMLPAMRAIMVSHSTPCPC